MKYLITLLLLAPMWASAATYYFASAGTGADSACVAGSDANDGLSPSTPKATLAGITGGPHTYRFARGCAWNGFQRNLTSATGTRTNPNIYEDYAPSWFPNQDSGTMTGAGTTTLTDSGKSWTTNQWAGYTVYVVAPHWQNSNPNLSRQKATVVSNTATTLTVSAWLHIGGIEAGATPVAGSSYTIQGAMPRLNAANSSTPMWNAEDSGAPNLEEGFVLRNLEMVGYSATGSAPFGYLAKCLSVYNITDYITLDNVICRHFGIGVHTASSNAGYPATHPLGYSKGITIRNSTIYDNKTQGYLGGADGLLIERNWFDLNGWGSSSGRDHNVYPSAYGPNNTIQFNTLTRAARHAGSSTLSPLTQPGGPDNYPCSGIPFVSHGTYPNMLVQGNFIYESRANGACYGISLDGNSTGKYPNYSDPMDYSNLVIRDNMIVYEDVSTIAINCSSCPGALIENNTIVRLGNGSGTAIIAPSPLSVLYWNGDTQTGSPPTYTLTCPSPNIVTANDVRCDVIDDRPTIRNNSIYTASTSSTAHGIHYQDNAAVQGALADDLRIVNNLLVYGASSSTSARCFNYGGRDSTKFIASGNNLCFRPSAPATWYEGGTLATAQAAGLDTGSLTSDPLLTQVPAASNFWRIVPNTGSPAINGGNATHGSAFAARGCRAVGTRDIGAEESGCATIAPAAPRARAQ